METLHIRAIPSEVPRLPRLHTQGQRTYMSRICSRDSAPASPLTPPPTSSTLAKSASFLLCASRLSSEMDQISSTLRVGKPCMKWTRSDAATCVQMERKASRLTPRTGQAKTSTLHQDGEARRENFGIGSFFRRCDQACVRFTDDFLPAQQHTRLGIIQRLTAEHDRTRGLRDRASGRNRGRRCLG